MLTIIVAVLTLISVASSFLLKKLIPSLYILVCFVLSFAIVFTGFTALAVATVRITGF
jgi:hypothetical protein